ncbi:MAG: hypothetical protein P4L42_12050 [Desulfocapsaceae bacterium]|nr:hypothetical protein [Desulfocapsaceae bacterium]
MKRVVCILLLSQLFNSVSVYGADSISTTGSLSLSGIEQIDHASRSEAPSLTAQVEANAQESSWRLHTLIEGGWDGASPDPQQYHSLVKDFTHVYQDNSPFVEFKELYLEEGAGDIHCRIGIQRFSWGRLDEYPANDLLNPWDYNRFMIKSIEDRKIGVPSVSIDMNRSEWGYQIVWVPWLVPYRLPDPNTRWSIVPAGSTILNNPNAQIIAPEPDLPDRNLDNGSIGFRMQHAGQLDWALNFFHGFDPRPVFKTTTLAITQSGDKFVTDPGVTPSFNKITSIGSDGAMVIGEWSLRAETAFTLGRTFNIRQELWGYPEVFDPGEYTLNPAVEVKRNTLDYGIGADYRLKEDWLITLQVQQTEIFDRPDSFYDEERETLLWANFKIYWLNQKIETNLNIAYNPEHGASMIRPSISYILTDNWKVSINGLFLDGPSQSIFGRYANNDQVEMILIIMW